MTTRPTFVTDGIPEPGAIGRVAIGDIVRRAARRHPDRIALIEGDVRVTFAALDADINRFANFLLGSGLEKGDRVASLCQNSYQFVIALFGIQKAGLIWVPVNTGLAQDDVRYILEHSEARLAIVDEHTPRLHFAAFTGLLVLFVVLGKLFAELQRDPATHDADTVNCVHQGF